MSVDYIGRLNSNRTLLKSSDNQTVQDALDALFELWQKYSDNPKFYNELKEIYYEYPPLIDEFTIRLANLEDSPEKIEALKGKLDLLCTPETIQSTPNVQNFNRQDDSYKSIPSAIFPPSPKKYPLEHSEFVIPRSIARIAIILFGVAILIGGLSISSDFSIGIIISVLLLIASIILLSINLFK